MFFRLDMARPEGFEPPTLITDDSLAHESAKVIPSADSYFAVATKKSVVSVTCSTLFPPCFHSRIPMRAGRKIGSKPMRTPSSVFGAAFMAAIREAIREEIRPPQAMAN